MVLFIKCVFDFPMQSVLVPCSNGIGIPLDMDMLYFSDTVPYSYQNPYKQGPYYNCDFNNSCTYPSVGALSNACRYNSVTPSYGQYALQQANYASLFQRKPGRIKGMSYN